MLTAQEQLHIDKVESIQLGNEILFMVDGGEDICCTLNQWAKDWIGFNKYSVQPNTTTPNHRLFAMEFETEF